MTLSFPLIFASVLLLLVVQINATSCLLDLQCPHLATCEDRKCSCRNDRGLVGDANSCVCPASKITVWSDFKPYCIDLPAVLAYEAQKKREEILTGIISSLYTDLVWPGPATIMKELVEGNLTYGIFAHVAPDAVGRVDPVGEMDTPDGVVEYFYGSVWSGDARIYKVEIPKLFANGDKVFVRVDMYFDVYVSGTKIWSYVLTQTGTFTFNSDNKIKSFDLVILNLNWALGPVGMKTDQTIPSLCYMIVNLAHCNATYDPTGYYTDFNDCVSTLSNKEFGTWDMARADSIVCRQYHAGLAVARPSVHCPHAGKNGGGKCTPHNIADYYLKKY